MSKRKHRQGTLRRLRNTVRDEVPAQPSPLPKSFLTLPRELRDEAYKHILIAPMEISLERLGPSSRGGRTSAEKQFRKLCRINRQIRSEAREIFFQYNTFWMSQEAGYPVRHPTKQDPQIFRYDVADVRKFHLARGAKWHFVDKSDDIFIELTRESSSTCVRVRQPFVTGGIKIPPLEDWKKCYEEEVANVVTSRSRKECLTEGELGSILDLMALSLPESDFGFGASSA